MKQAIQSLERIKNATDTIRGRISILERIGSRESDADKKLAEASKKVREAFEKEMDDDFNTPGALAEIFTYVREINTLTKDVGGAAVLREALAVLTELVGILGVNLSDEAQVGEEAGQAAETLKGVIEFMLELREDARKSKDFAKADQIRDRLGDLGIEIADTKDGPTWKIS
ncbi:MAG: DALR domain-containing protein [Candidatus Thorarchaeota archaeon]